MEESNLATYFNIIDEGGDIQEDTDVKKALNAANTQTYAIVKVKTLVLGC
jgi:hypothetical protein